jgi:capsular exopolysaccharide synthesis family protein
MTRLTEALERARATATEGTPRLVPKPGDAQRNASAWNFEEEPVDVAGERSASVDLPTAWKLDAEVPEPKVTAKPLPEASPVAPESTARPERKAEVKQDTEPQPDKHDRGKQAAARTVDVQKAEVVEAAPKTARVVKELDFERMEVKLADIAKLALGGHTAPSVIEQYRSLAAAVHHAQLQNDAQVLMITSAVEGEGKTLTSTNLALTLSHSYHKRVLLIDADLRRPSIHHLLQLDNTVGLGDTLKQSHPHGALPVQRLLPTLWVITAGQPNSDPMGALVSDTMKQFLVDAAEQFDWIVIDTPPVALLPDANLLAAMVDTALLVVSAGTTPHGLVTRAIDAIGRAKILGVVLNKAEEELRLGYDHHSYAYGHPTPPRQRRFGL